MVIFSLNVSIKCPICRKLNTKNHMEYFLQLICKPDFLRSAIKETFVINFDTNSINLCILSKYGKVPKKFQFCIEQISEMSCNTAQNSPQDELLILQFRNSQPTARPCHSKWSSCGDCVLVISKINNVLNNLQKSINEQNTDDTLLQNRPSSILQTTFPLSRTKTITVYV